MTKNKLTPYQGFFIALFKTYGACFLCKAGAFPSLFSFLFFALFMLIFSLPDLNIFKKPGRFLRALLIAEVFYLVVFSAIRLSLSVSSLYGGYERLFFAVIIICALLLLRRITVLGRFAEILRYGLFAAVVFSLFKSGAQRARSFRFTGGICVPYLIKQRTVFPSGDEATAQYSAGGGSFKNKRLALFLIPSLGALSGALLYILILSFSNDGMGAVTLSFSWAAAFLGISVLLSEK